MNPSTNKQRIQNTTQEVTEKASEMAGKFGTEVENISAKVSDRAESFLSNAKHTLSDAATKITNGYSVVKDEAKKTSFQLESAVKKNPLLAVGVAVGAGWVLAKIFSSRKQQEA